MSKRPLVVAFDLEGVFTPEVWIAVAESTGVADLRLTTRDLPDYDELMRRRIALLRVLAEASGSRVYAVVPQVGPRPVSRARTTFGATTRVSLPTFRISSSAPRSPLRDRPAPRRGRSS